MKTKITILASFLALQSALAFGASLKSTKTYSGVDAHVISTTQNVDIDDRSLCKANAKQVIDEDMAVIEMKAERGRQKCEVVQDS